MDEEVFRACIAEFNAANFDALALYYADDVVFSFNGGLTLHGRNAIVDFYRPFLMPAVLARKLCSRWRFRTRGACFLSA